MGFPTRATSLSRFVIRLRLTPPSHSSLPPAPAAPAAPSSLSSSCSLSCCSCCSCCIPNSSSFSFRSSFLDLRSGCLSASPFSSLFPSALSPLLLHLSLHLRSRERLIPFVSLLIRTRLFCFSRSNSVNLSPSSLRSVSCLDRPLRCFWV